LGGVIQNALPATLTEKLAGHLDTVTGLQYDGARYYDPWVGSYVQPDPFGGLPQAPQSLNRFGLAADSIPAYVLAQYEPGSVSPLAVDAGKLAVLKSVSKGLLANPLVQFGLNKALISTVWEEPLPEGLIKYRLARQVMPWAKRHIPDFTWGIGRQFVAEYRTVGTVAGVPLQVAERWRLKFGRDSLAAERSVVNTADGFRVVATNYDRVLNLGKLARSVPLEGPLFVLDVGFNAYFQYQTEANLPQDLRLKRAIAGGTGNAIISAGITFIGGVAIASTCVGTGPACPLALGALTLTADFTANLAFDVRLKDPFLERVGLGRKWYKE
jgi:RHS repeat-associated protein